MAKHRHDYEHEHEVQEPRDFKARVLAGLLAGLLIGVLAGARGDAVAGAAFRQEDAGQASAAKP